MATERDEDRLEGEFGRRTARAGNRSATFPSIAIADTKRARAAWFNRPRGAGRVKLAPVREPGSQRVIVKLKPVVHAQVKGGGGAGGLMRHALYVERDGAGREGQEVRVFDRELDEADGRGFVDRCEDDRHHFRVILSPEYGAELELRSYTRELMRQVETDLRTRLDWIAAEHHDTGRPHVHLLIRGRRECGRDLVIPRAYVSHGFRQRAEAIATRELGPRLDQSLGQELERRSERAAKLERLTHLDRELRAHARDGEVRLNELKDKEARERAALMQRLNRLEDWGLARREAPDLWRLDPDLEGKLARLGDARARERAQARLLAREDLGPTCERLRELEQAQQLHQRVTGRLVGWEELSSDSRGPFLIAVEGVDGGFWTVRVAREKDLRALAGVERGAIVALERSAPGLRPADRTIMEIAGDEGFYSPERHRELRPADRAEYIQMHVRRLEALRREGVVERLTDGRFLVPPDYKARVLAREARGGRESARIELLDPHALKTQARYPGPTWLDRAAAGLEDLNGLERTGFGKEAIEHWAKREAFLKELGLGRDGAEGLVPDGDWLERLREMEKEALLKRIERDLGRIAHIAREGERVQGVFTSRIHAAERSYALIVQDRFATLAPWRPEMDRALNQFVSGRVNGRDFDFKFGREVEKALQRSLGLGR
jgi:type IV secretory pathway VirD2 relaxase